MSKAIMLEREIYLVRRLHEIQAEKFDDNEDLQALILEEHNVNVELGQIRLALYKDR